MLRRSNIISLIIFGASILRPYFVSLCVGAVIIPRTAGKIVSVVQTQFLQSFSFYIY